MAAYSGDRYNRQAAPDDIGLTEIENSWHVLRNGKRVARFELLGDARAYVRRTVEYAGAGDKWEIVEG